MISHPYRILTGAGLALVVGVVGAQTYGDRPATMPADKNVPQTVQTQPAQPSDQKSADPAVRLPAAKSVPRMTKPTQQSTQHATKARGMPEHTAMQGDNAYREALRQCAKEQDQNARDRCLNTAIEQFHRNS